MAARSAGRLQFQPQPPREATDPQNKFKRGWVDISVQQFSQASLPPSRPTPTPPSRPRDASSHKSTAPSRKPEAASRSQREYWVYDASSPAQPRTPLFLACTGNLPRISKANTVREKRAIEMQYRAVKQAAQMAKDSDLHRASVEEAAQQDKLRNEELRQRRDQQAAHREQHRAQVSQRELAVKDAVTRRRVENEKMHDKKLWRHKRAEKAEYSKRQQSARARKARADKLRETGDRLRTAGMERRLQAMEEQQQKFEERMAAKAAAEEKARQQRKEHADNVKAKRDEYLAEQQKQKQLKAEAKERKRDEVIAENKRTIADVAMNFSLYSQNRQNHAEEKRKERELQQQHVVQTSIIREQTRAQQVRTQERFSKLSNTLLKQKKSAQTKRVLDNLAAIESARRAKIDLVHHKHDCAVQELQERKQQRRVIEQRQDALRAEHTIKLQTLKSRIPLCQTEAEIARVQMDIEAETNRFTTDCEKLHAQLLGTQAMSPTSGGGR